MSVVNIVTGGAHSSESGGKDGAVGDQLQTGQPDYSGEVSFRNNDESTFKSRYSGCMIYRPLSSYDAASIASIVSTACNNPNVGYGQSDRDGIFRYGPDSTVPINCDCASLISYAVSAGTGASVDATTADMAAALVETGLFMAAFSVATISFATNPPYNGDIILRTGHVEAVVGGNPRTGTEDELASGTFSGDGNAIQQYRTAYGEGYEFVPRKTYPPEDGYYAQSYGTTKNGSYAWGRFSEILHSECDLSKNAPRTWYPCKEDGYERGTVPALGAVMCYTHLYDVTDPGLVCIVESIESDKIYISQRNPKTSSFEYTSRKQKSGSWDLDLDKDGSYEYAFQGFIYNPGVPIDTVVAAHSNTFIENATAAVGKDISYVQKYVKLSSATTAWSAAFIVAVAKQTGNIIDVVIPNTNSVSDIGKVGVKRGMGTWYDGPSTGGTVVPEPGDLALFRTSTATRTSKYGADKAGIVIKTSSVNVNTSGTNQTTSASFVVAMGDCSGGKIKKVTYTTTSKSFSGLFRPDWDTVDGANSLGIRSRSMDGLYTEGTSLQDAAIRDLRYVKLTETGFEPSIKSSGILLCAINYTGMLANLYTSFSEVESSPGTNATYVVAGINNNSESQYQKHADDYVSIVSDASASVSAKQKTTVKQAGQKIVAAETPSAVSAIATAKESLPAEPSTSPVVSKSSVSSEPTSGTVVEEIASTEAQLEGGGSAKVGEDTVKLTPTMITIYKALKKFLGNSAGAIGIMGNMYVDSNFEIDKTGSTGGIGLCQWYSARASAMRKYCLEVNEEPYQDNLTGQLSYLMYELDTNFKQVKETCKKVDNSLEGAYTACSKFLRKYLITGNYGAEEASRKEGTHVMWLLIKGMEDEESKKKTSSKKGTIV